ncbi:glycosyltransferase family 4 protein [Pusillimonas sp. CC-YST705]|uniref:Glycosyltransferase family 4 protein n=1 Tax=Mesopusillimonas faecipullorum TaxID=2755040 RepID=A0ABS8CB10_9BURK|nr:glycosyltransferase family 4 protein [Mesopusillimonas faecipullorum]MCB5363226.1 glycosyltransferase family 4 protein [Mesopusillimonas faecipullorum]
MKKTIWYVSKYFESPTENSPGGRPFLVWKELAKDGFDAVVITSDSNHLMYVPKVEGSVLEQNLEGVKVYWLNTLKITTAKSFRRILSWLHFEFKLFFMNKKKLPTPDLVVVSSLSLLTILNGFLLRRKYGCKLAFEIRDIWPMTLTEEGGYSKSNVFVRVLAYIEKLGYKHADYIIGTMPNLGEHVKNVLGYEKPAYCLPMGVPNEVIDISTDLVDASYFDQYFPKGKFFVVYAGTVGITNALDIFFECAQKMAGHENIHFVVLGDGGLRASYQEKYGSLPNLTFAARVEKYQVQSVLSRADVLYLSTFPSEIWRYGQSLNKMIDYMLAGKPVIASYNGYPSMINEAESGYFIPAGDLSALVSKIEALYALPETERVEIGKRGRRWLLENRSYQKIKDDFVKDFL